METDKAILMFFAVIGIGLIIIAGVRTCAYDGRYKCGLEQNQLCTSNPTAFYLLIGSISLIFFFIGMMIKVYFESAQKGRKLTICKY